jgi:putative transposase
MLVLLLVALLLIVATFWILVHRRPRRGRRPLKPVPSQPPSSRKKPKWVSTETIRLCALMPHDGCRKIANTFNRLHADKGESIGKTYVATLMKRRALAILLSARGSRIA